MGQDVGPLLEGPVGGSDQASGLASSGGQAEEVVGGDGVQRGEAELVNDDQVGAQDAVNDLG